MRLFVALPVPDRERDALAGLLAGWRPLDWPVRWVRRESIHLTLRFLGELPGESLPGLCTALDASAADTGRVELVPRGVEFYPSRRPRVLWVALEPVPALELLAHRVERALEHLPGVRPVDGPFRPHITLGRVARDGRVPAEVHRRVAGAALPGAFLAERLVLYESELDGGAPRYLERHVVELVAPGNDSRSGHGLSHPDRGR